MSGTEITDYADSIHNNTYEYWVIRKDMIWRKHNDDGIFNSSTKIWDNKGIVNWNIINRLRDMVKGRENLYYLKIYPVFQHRMPANNSCLSTYFKYSKSCSTYEREIPSIYFDGSTYYASEPKSYTEYYQSPENFSISNYKNIEINSEEYSPMYIYKTSGETGKLYQLGTYNKDSPQYNISYDSTPSSSNYGYNSFNVTYTKYDGSESISREFRETSRQIEKGVESYMYTISSNTLRYPQNINEGTFTPYNKTEDSEYLFVEYIKHK